MKYFLDDMSEPFFGKDDIMLQDSVPPLGTTDEIQQKVVEKEKSVMPEETVDVIVNVSSFFIVKNILKLYCMMLCVTVSLFF